MRVRRCTLQSVEFRRLCVSARKIKSRGWLLKVGCWDFAGGPVAVLSVHGNQLRSLVRELDPTFYN